MRAASMDFGTARMLGVRANRVISGAVVISGSCSRVAAVMLSVEQTQITSTFALSDTIYVLDGRRRSAGSTGRSRRRSAASRSASPSGSSAGSLPTNQSQYLPSFIFAAVIVVLLLRPNGLFTRATGAVERL